MERSSRVDSLPRHCRGSRICSGYQPLGSVLLPQPHDCQRQQDASGSALDAHDDWIVLLRCRSLLPGLDCTGKHPLDWVFPCSAIKQDGAACIGLGFFTIFQSAINYLVDTYLMVAASALAANMFMRSILAAAFPLFASYCKYLWDTGRRCLGG